MNKSKLKLKLDSGFLLLVMHPPREIDGQPGWDPDDYEVLADLTPRYKGWVKHIAEFEMLVGVGEDLEDALKLYSKSTRDASGAIVQAAIKAIDALISKKVSP